MPQDPHLPDARPPPLLQPAPSPERPLAGLTVLAVEDSRFACDALRLMCQRLGARLRRAETLAAAAAHLRTYRPDAVLVDLGLPDGPGTGLIAQLATLGPARPLVIGMSGEDGAEGLALAAGAAGYLAKPLHGLAAFRDALIAHLPDRAWLGTSPVRPADALPAPDALALRDDLVRAAACLAHAGPGPTRYVAGFVAGLARETRDAELARAARGPAEGLAPLLQARLASLPASGLFRLS
ncbi:MAG: response regulator [Gemmobacter sp.]